MQSYISSKLPISSCGPIDPQELWGQQPMFIILSVSTFFSYSVLSRLFGSTGQLRWIGFSISTMILWGSLSGTSFQLLEITFCAAKINHWSWDSSLGSTWEMHVWIIGTDIGEPYVWSTVWYWELCIEATSKPMLFTSSPWNSAKKWQTRDPIWRPFSRPPRPYGVLFLSHNWSQCMIASWN